MKKLILLSIIFLSLSSSAQNFPLVKDGGIWRESNYGITVPPDPPLPLSLYQRYMYGDTTLLNKTYKKLYLTNYDSIISNKTYLGAMREDSLGKIYYFRNGDTTEFILYDFSLEVGDTFFVNNAIYSIQIVYLVDSILISGQWRKKFIFINCLPPRIWIEGIGDTKGLLYPIQYEFENVQSLECYQDSNIFWPENSTPHACLSVGMEGDLQIPKDELQIFPNPANDNLHIKFSENTTHPNLKITVYNSIGVKVKSIEAKNNLELDINDLKSGIYFIQVQTESKAVYNSNFIKL